MSDQSDSASDILSCILWFNNLQFIIENGEINMKITRRQVLGTVGGIGAAGLLGGLEQEAKAKERPSSSRKKRRVLRLAHLTDIHVLPERNAEPWLATCLHHVQGLKDRPDLILNSGDSVMDSLGADAARTQAQWDVFTKVFKENCSLPVEHCIGNHDVWGWNQKKSGATGSEPLYGKKWVMEALGLKTRYRSFNKAGWHFIILDSTHYDEEIVYTARLDEEQYEWLVSDLASIKKNTPILVLSHIPILSACALFDGNNEKTGNWIVPGQWVHIDARRIKDLFLKHPNVKLCLSGHLHLEERVDYNQVTYLCDGAVCGAWWNGSYQECPPGYRVVDLYADGSFDYEYITYGWKPGS